MFKGINWLAVLVATVVSIVLGYVWFNVVFADMVHKLDPSANTAMKIDASFVGGVVTIFVLNTGLAWVFARTGVKGLGQALMTAFVVALAFDATVYAGFVFLNHAPVEPNAFYATFDMIAYLVSGAILALLPAKAPALAPAE